MEIIGFVMLLVMIGLLSTLTGGLREDPRMRRRWDARFDHESRQVRHTDATGVLMCRSCGASGSERAGRCPRCGAGL
ncbi:MAG: hypothetical protein ACRDF0_02610 [Candidatus Limnocylindria bacterium]